VSARGQPHGLIWVLSPKTYGFQIADIAGFKIAGFAGAPLPS
jgi:hypothetical protein